MTRVLLLHNIVNPHATPVFEALARAPGIELAVLYFAASEGDRRWGSSPTGNVEQQVLASRSINLPLRLDVLSLHYNPGLGKLLRERAWDVLINAGWASPSNWIGWRACLRQKKPQVLWSGSTAHEPSWRRTLTRPLVRRMVRSSDALVSYGSASARYLESLGAPKERITPGLHCIDNQRFLERCAAAQSEVASLRRSLGLEGRRALLFVGRCVRTKGGAALLEAFARVHAQLADVSLIVVGDGPERAEWEARARGLPVIFRGHQPLEALPAHYLLADAVVLPSLEEVWGLVINEAELAGRAVVATSSCGAAEDLIEEGVNGHVVPPDDMPALADALLRLLRDPRAAQRMGEESKRIVAHASPQGVASALASAVAQAIARKRSS